MPLVLGPTALSYTAGVRWSLRLVLSPLGHWVSREHSPTVPEAKENLCVQRPSRKVRDWKRAVLKARGTPLVSLILTNRGPQLWSGEALITEPVTTAAGYGDRYHSQRCCALSSYFPNKKAILVLWQRMCTNLWFVSMQRQQEKKICSVNCSRKSTGKWMPHLRAPLLEDRELPPQFERKLLEVAVPCSKG